MSKISMRFRPFPVWNSDGELMWLEEMARDGYRLVKSLNPIYFFERAEPEAVRYCHGFGRLKSKDRDDYFQLYADAGWQHVSSWVGWHYFKSGVATASDSDRVTVTRHNAKFLKSMAVIYLVGTVLFAFWFGALLLRGASWETALAGICAGVWAFSYWGLLYARKRQLTNAEKIQAK